MIWNTIPNDERLRLWRSLREDIKNFPLNEQLEKVAKFCATIPYGSRTLDYYTPVDWPTPWDILFHGTFCTSSISLLMYYTLVLIPHTKLELLLVDDNQDVFLLPIIDNQYILNYHLGQVSIFSEVQNELKVLQRYQEEEIKKIT